MDLFTLLVDGPPKSDLRWNRFRRMAALFVLILLGGTWRLWTPQTVFPQVPLFGWAANAPGWLDWGLLLAMVAMAGVALLAPPERKSWRIAWASVAVCLGLTILIDQHRFQPWAYLFILQGILFATCGARTGIGLLRLLVIGVYFYSALSKLDWLYLHSFGPWMARTFLEQLGLNAAGWSDDALASWVWILPAFEGVIAVGLCFAVTRKLAVGGAILMHALLLLILGPFGAEHKAGVLIWNSYFIVQAWLLFGPIGVGSGEAEKEMPEQTGWEQTYQAQAARWVIYAATLAPLVEPLGFWDHWPSWSLYAPRTSRVTVMIQRLAVDRLPDSIKKHLVESKDGSPYRELQIGRWSLDAVGAPIYPQDRFQLGVAEGLMRRYKLEGLIEVVQQGPASRLTGTREQMPLSQLQHIMRLGDRYRLGSHPNRRFIDAANQQE